MVHVSPGPRGHKSCDSPAEFLFRIKHVAYLYDFRETENNKGKGESWIKEWSNH